MKEVKCEHCGYWTYAASSNCNYCSSAISIPDVPTQTQVSGMDSGSFDKPVENWWVRLLKWAVGRGSKM